MKKTASIIIFILSVTTLFSQTLIRSINGSAQEEFLGAHVAISADGARASYGTEDQYNTNPTWPGFVTNIETVGSQIGARIIGPNNNYHPGDIDVSDDGNRVIVGYPHYLSANAEVDGKVKVFDHTTGWTQVGNDLIGVTSDAYNDAMGSSVTISANGNRIAAGSPGALNGGEVNIYEEIAGNWVQLGATIKGGSGTLEFGKTVSLSYNGKRMVIGAKDLVRIYEENNGQWHQVGSDIFSIAPDDGTGTSMSISENGSRVAVGSSTSTNNGILRVFEEVGGIWTQLGGQKILDNWYAPVLSISGDGKLLAVGDPDVSNVMLFNEVNGDWVQVGDVLYGDFTYGISGFGYAVALSNDGSTLIVGEPEYSVPGPEWSHGRVRIYDVTNLKKGVFGNIYRDFNLNCNQDSLEIGIENHQVTINPGNMVLSTGATGVWSIPSLTAGTYTITVNTIPNMSTNCPLTQTFTVVHPDSLTIVPDFGFFQNNPCPLPDVSIHMPFMRPCFSNQYIYVQATNASLGSIVLNNPYVIVKLDHLISPTAFELPYTVLGNNEFQVDLPSLLPGQTIRFWIKATLDCQAQLGQALCVEAQLLPLEECTLDTIPNPYPPGHTPCNTQWDGSSLTVNGYCQNDSVFFEITNIGDIGADMTCYSPVNVYVDGVLYLQDSVMLNAQQTVVFAFPANGESWHLEVFQHPLHPGNSFPKVTVENCGGQTGQTKVNLFAQNDADPHIDIYCGEVTGSYDPNDKTGYPHGLTEDHYIPANQQLQYRIRFQNTGTDTAFTVKIRDTLSFQLDPSTVRPGVSSHNYSFHIIDNHILEWVFPNIMLPDSNINEPLSHGFVWFTVEQMPNLPDGTLIENSAGIYFDFNAPVITNTYKHTIGEPQIILNINEPETSVTSSIKLFPNPTEGHVMLDFNQQYTEVKIQVTDVSGKLIQEETQHNSTKHNLTINQPNGVYFINIETNTGLKEAVKLVKVTP